MGAELTTTFTATLGHGCIITEYGIEIPTGLPHDEWVDVGVRLGDLTAHTERVASALSWAIGQWLAWGEHTWGEKYAQASDVLGLAEQTLMNMQYVVEAFGGKPLRPSLSFAHHSEVASLPAATRAAILGRAESEGLSAREVRGLAQVTRALAAGKDPARERAANALERALQDVRECEPSTWPDLVFRAVKPMCQAPGFARALACLLLATVESETKGDSCSISG
jgi:hypothetical protein